MRRFREAKAWTAIAIVAGSLAAGTAQGQIPLGPAQTRFQTVAGWEGSFSLVVNQSGTTSVPSGAASYSVGRKIEAKVKLDKLLPFSTGWTGAVEGVVSINDKYTIPVGICTSVHEVKGTGNLAIGGLTGMPEQASLTFDRGADTWSLSLRENAVKADWTNTLKCPGIPDQVAVNAQQATQWHAQIGPMGLPFPASGLQLIGKEVVKGQGDRNGGMDVVLKADLTYDLKPILSELEVIIEPQGYDQWRPEAAADEATPGNDITVKATLRHEDGSPLSANEKARKFEFQLANVSKEPGIAMNYPLAAEAKKTPDLQFDKARNDRLPIILTGTDQADSFGLPHETASAIVSAYDWGAWGEIKVTAVTVDGRRIVGYLKGDKAQTSVRLPKRAKDSFIADGWKASKGLSSGVQDKDDKEKEPQSLPGCDGDGLAVYEEYRGFIEKGKHIEGNLDKKDFFILNLIGADAEPGIWWFTEVSQLEVHKDLKEDEMSKDDRLINGNCDKCPHRVAQHGVYMEEVEGMSGGATEILDDKLRARPGLTTSIEIAPRMAVDAINRVNLSSLDRPLLYDKIVAHELGHSVGLEHHGEGDVIQKFSLIRPEDQPGPVQGRPYLTDRRGNPVTLLDEITEIDVIDRVYSAYVSARAYIQARRDSGNPLTPESEVEMEQGTLALKYSVGRPSQEHSGAVECIMRYNYATAYPKERTQSPQEVFYLIPPGTEPLGSQLCDTAEGTRTNAPRWPQPRFFGAADGRGNCSKWVCVNDDIPPGRL